MDLSVNIYHFLSIILSIIEDAVFVRSDHSLAFGYSALHVRSARSVKELCTYITVTLYDTYNRYRICDRYEQWSL